MTRKNIGIWIRVSTEDQKRGDSPEHHLDQAKTYAKLHSYDVVETYDLTGVSGKTVKDHPECQRMLMDIHRGHISGLIFSKIARFARNTIELLQFANFFQEHNADLISLKESFDTSTPAGRLFFRIISSMAEWEREEIVDRINASVETRAKMGKVMGGIPYGYQRKDKDDIELHPEESVVRKKMYELYLQHQRYGTVARILNEEGHRTKRGKKFSDMAIKRLLKDPITKGVRRTRFTKVGKNGQPELRDSSEWYFHEAPQIVSEELWESVNDIIHKYESSKTQPFNKKLKLFTGFLICDCGGKMYVPSSNPKYTCKKCKRKIPTEDIEEIFKSQLKQFLLSEEDIQKYYESSQTGIKDKERELIIVKEKIDKLKTKIEKLFELHVNNQIETARFNEFYKEPNEQLKQLERTIPTLESEIKILKEHAKSSEFIIDEAQTLYDNWDNLSNEEKRRVVETITKDIIVGDQEVNINLYSLSPPKKDTSFLKLTANGQYGL
ncbi:MAG: recombinase family protein [Flavobacteriaceae bacterium]